MKFENWTRLESHRIVSSRLGLPAYKAKNPTLRINHIPQLGNRSNLLRFRILHRVLAQVRLRLQRLEVTRRLLVRLLVHLNWLKNQVMVHDSVTRWHKKAAQTFPKVAQNIQSNNYLQWMYFKIARNLSLFSYSSKYIRM